MVNLGLLQYLEANNKKLTKLKRVAIGGSACPRAVAETFEQKYGVEVIHAWGMTEMSPIGTISGPLPASLGEPDDATRMAYNLKQGRVPFGVDLKITTEEGDRLPHDGVAPGHIKVSGPAVLQRYFRDETSAVDAEGFFDTGDIGTVDPHGYLQITDRSKDLIKSGGEWISSVDMEAAIIAMPQVAGLAGYALLANGNGELGITTAAAWRGWLGPYLLDLLVEVAHAEGVPNIEADVRLDVTRAFWSLVVARDLPSGHVLGPADVVMKSPAGGIPPYEWDAVIGRVTLKPLHADDFLTFEVLGETRTEFARS